MKTDLTIADRLGLISSVEGRCVATPKGVDQVAEENDARAIHPREREIVALTYVLAIVPLFGILVAAIVALFYQERSRTVVFHAKQAIAGQAFVLLVFVVVCLFRLFAALVGVISPGLERVFVLFDMFVLYAVGLIYIVWCVYFAWKSLDGRDLEYPLIGARLRNRSE